MYVPELPDSKPGFLCLVENGFGATVFSTSIFENWHWKDLKRPCHIFSQYTWFLAQLASPSLWPHVSHLFHHRSTIQTSPKQGQRCWCEASGGKNVPIFESEPDLERAKAADRRRCLAEDSWWSRYLDYLDLFQHFLPADIATKIPKSHFFKIWT